MILIVHNSSSRRGSRVACLLRGDRTVAGEEGRSQIEWIDLRELAGAAIEGVERIVAVGGDGTVNAVGSFLLERGLRVPVGIVPAGTGNNLCQGLGLPEDPREAYRVATVSRAMRDLDVFRVDSQDPRGVCHVFQTSALGFPSDIARRYDRLRQRPLPRLLMAPLGLNVYRLLALLGVAGQRWAEWRGKGTLRVRMRLPGEGFESPAIAVCVGNERSLGGNFLPCPAAEMEDGLLDVCLLEGEARVSYLWMLGRVAKGQHVGAHPAVHYWQSEGPLRIELSEPATLLVDGDFPRTSSWYEYRILPKRFQVVVKELSSKR
jgi:diacylglycerol kinase (ATP)